MNHTELSTDHERKLTWDDAFALGQEKGLERGLEQGLERGLETGRRQALLELVAQVVDPQTHSALAAIDDVEELAARCQQLLQIHR